MIGLKSNIVLAVLAALSIGALVLIEYTKVSVKSDYYEDMLAAAQKAELAGKILKETKFENSVFIDMVNDPNETALIGERNTAITTDMGYLESKLTSTNPNFAAIIVDMLNEAGCEKGDYVAVAQTGSFPAVNIAVYAAIEQMELNPIVITSVGSSNWGANDPDYTWLDMESILIERGAFNTKSVAASIGGGKDIGRGLSPKGRKQILEAIERNGVDLIKENHLIESVKKRMSIYDENAAGKDIKAFINVGGGAAALGSSQNGDLIPVGYSERIPDVNYPAPGAITKMGERNVPVINLYNISKLARQYELPGAPSPLPEAGEASIFKELKYDIKIVIIVTLVLFAIIGVLIYFDNKRNKLGKNNIEIPDINGYKSEEL
jgi:poly-gamma-glutamate system protein